MNHFHVRSSLLLQVKNKAVTEDYIMNSQTVCKYILPDFRRCIKKKKNKTMLELEQIAGGIDTFCGGCLTTEHAGEMLRKKLYILISATLHPKQSLSLFIVAPKIVDVWFTEHPRYHVWREQAVPSAASA